MRLLFNRAFYLLIFTVCVFPADLVAQLSQGGVPGSFSHAIAPESGNFISIDPPSTDQLSMEETKPGVAYSFAVNLPVDIGMDNSGLWTTTADGTRIWRVTVKASGALALTLYFDRFAMPENGKLFVYNPQRTQIIGAFTNQNNNRHSTFATSLIYGDQLTLEYNAPEGTPDPVMHVSEVAYAYRGVSDYSGLKTGFGGSGPCEVNTNCDEGAAWQLQKRSVTRILIKRTGQTDVWCTGSLVNNVRNDGTPYVLTADHCGRYSSETDISKWIFYFNYEGTGCPDPTKEPTLYSLTGATMVAHGGNAAASGSDFFLVLLDKPIPTSYNVYFNGWTRESVPPSPSGVTIHHPEGDIKKISTYTKALQPTVWTGGSKLAHWLVYWTKTTNGQGVTEGGSSGSPLYDNQGRLVGTLTGGDSRCDTAHINLPDYYGMFSYSWDKNGTDSTEVLKYWLDPDSTNVMSLNGWALGVEENVNNEWVAMYPNPVTNQLNIRMAAGATKSLKVTLYDILGNLQYQRALGFNENREIQVDVSELSPGIYVVMVNDGNRQVVRKVIKE